jgi:phosphatidylglycerophosphate synthase
VSRVSKASPFLRDLSTVPNLMSVFRLLATPLLPLLWFGFDMMVAALALGTLIGLTDALDGWVARKLNQTTELGGLIDQLGDLVFESTGILIGVLHGEIWSGVLILYLFREFTVNVVRSYVLGHGGQLPSSVLGKAKSSCIQWAFFFFFLGCILLEPGVLPPEWSMLGITPGRILVWVAIVSILSGIACGLIAGYRYLQAFVVFYAERIAR